MPTLRWEDRKVKEAAPIVARKARTDEQQAIHAELLARKERRDRMGDILTADSVLRIVGREVHRLTDGKASPDECSALVSMIGERVLRRRGEKTADGWIIPARSLSREWVRWQVAGAFRGAKGGIDPATGKRADLAVEDVRARGDLGDSWRDIASGHLPMGDAPIERDEWGREIGEVRSLSVPAEALAEVIADRLVHDRVIRPNGRRSTAQAARALADADVAPDGSAIVGPDLIRRFAEEGISVSMPTLQTHCGRLVKRLTQRMDRDEICDLVRDEASRLPQSERIGSARDHERPGLDRAALAAAGAVAVVHRAGELRHAPARSAWIAGGTIMRTGEPTRTRKVSEPPTPSVTLSARYGVGKRGVTPLDLARLASGLAGTQAAVRPTGAKARAMASMHAASVLAGLSGAERRAAEKVSRDAAELLAEVAARISTEGEALIGPAR